MPLVDSRDMPPDQQILLAQQDASAPGAIGAPQNPNQPQLQQGGIENFIANFFSGIDPTGGGLSQAAGFSPDRPNLPLMLAAVLPQLITPVGIGKAGSQAIQSSRLLRSLFTRPIKAAVKSGNIDEAADLTRRMITARKTGKFTREVKFIKEGDDLIFEGFHGTFNQNIQEVLESGKKLNFGGLHAGSERAAIDRLVNTRASAGMGQFGEKASEVLPVRIKLKKPIGSPSSPISENDLFFLINDKNKLKEAIDAGFDGVIYLNSAEDVGSISVAAFSSSAVKIIKP